ncbi:PTS lactose/cellobiose transporter subunit IIA [Pelosinus sp. sgz500959]|uniref:PTS lactose/cellobiose transporter subunit IIA n=1 Tax=Pelosinus sp. sgz500959 TaxID=3242472 RepID=UPI00366CB24C
MEISEEVIFKIIVYSGGARSDIFEAFQLCKNGQYAEAQTSLDSAKEQLQAAHKVQTDLIQKEAAGDSTVVKLLMVHAQDHLMTCMLAKDIMANMMDMQKEIREIKNSLKL